MTNGYVRKSKFSKSQIVCILKKVEPGTQVGKTCRKHGISDADLLPVENPVQRHSQLSPEGWLNELLVEHAARHELGMCGHRFI